MYWDRRGIQRETTIGKKGETGSRGKHMKFRCAAYDKINARNRMSVRSKCVKKKKSDGKILQVIITGNKIAS